jgi:predicted AAA+ superfamily ATPase
MECRSPIWPKTELYQKSIFRFAAIARETIAIVGIRTCGTYSLLDQSIRERDDPCAFH